VTLTVETVISPGTRRARRFAWRCILPAREYCVGESQENVEPKQLQGSRPGLPEAVVGAGYPDVLFD
jgi:hypothetical protein